MARLKDIVDLMERTKYGCDKRCAKCELYLPKERMCYHEAERKREAWNEEKSKRFAKLLKGEINA